MAVRDDRSPKEAELEPSSSSSARVGRVELELVGLGSHGGAYRLREAIVRGQGPDQTLFLHSEDAPNVGVVSAVVSPGEYSTFLPAGWSLERVGEGTRIPVTLLTPNPDSFSVASGARTRLVMRFRVDGDQSSEADSTTAVRDRWLARIAIVSEI